MLIKAETPTVRDQPNYISEILLVKYSKLPKGTKSQILDSYKVHFQRQTSLRFREILNRDVVPRILEREWIESVVGLHYQNDFVEVLPRKRIVVDAKENGDRVRREAAERIAKRQSDDAARIKKYR